MASKEEYLFLREEIIYDTTAVQNYRKLMYTTVAAIYTIAFTQSEPLIFLVPIAVILPIFKMCMARRSSMCRIGAYLLVFLEADDSVFHWETRLHKYDDVYAIGIKKSMISPYTVSVLVSVALCIIRMDFDCFTSPENIIRLGICAVVGTISLIIISKGQVDYIKEKEKFIERWKYIKEHESEKGGTN